MNQFKNGQILYMLMNKKQNMTSSIIVVSVLIQVILSVSGVTTCIITLPSYYYCFQSCWNTGGVCDNYGKCTCTGMTTSKSGRGCWCTQPLTCSSGGCFTGCYGGTSDDTNYYITPPLTPNRCIACIVPQVCSDYAVISCSNGAPIFQKEFCCSTNCAACDQYTCTQCSYPSAQYSTGLSCTFCESNQICQNSQITGCIGAYYYELSTCNACGYNCASCTASNCTSCTSSTQFYISPTTSDYLSALTLLTCMTCSSPMICVNSQIDGCISGYYLQGQQICKPCSNNCLTCSSQIRCLSCDSSLFRILQNNLCKCMDGYYLYKDICVKIDCLSSLGKQYLTCQYFDCSDGVWEYGEQCDDGNFMNRDGCSNCMIEQGHTCSNTILEPSICFTLPINCISGTISDDSVNCNLCSDGYYLLLNECLQCQPQCLTCNYHKQCINCRFPYMSLQQECNLCESQPGQYSNYFNNQCETICGDGITSQSEQCDIGNQYSLGCTRCQFNPGYYCNTNECFKIQYPTPILTQIEQSQSLYNNNRQFKLEYNTPIQIQDINLFSQIILYNLDNSIDYTYQWIQNSQQQFILNMTLNTQSIGDQLTLNFVNITQILSDQNYCQQIKSLTVNISDYLHVSTATIQAIQGLGISTEYLLIILGVFVGLSILFGGLETFWNLLDLLQIMSYLQYINTIYPYNLQTFLNLFSFVQLSNLPINQYLNLKYYLQDYIIFDNFQQPPQLISDDGFTTITILNIVPISMAWFYAILIYLGAKFMFRGIQVSNIILTEQDTTVTIKLKIWFLMIKSKILQICQIINSEFIYSGIIRTFQSSAYDISFVIILGIYGFDIYSNDQFVQLNSILTTFLAFTYLISVYMIFRLAGFNISTLVLHKSQYGAVFESSKLDKFSVYLNSLALVKKFLFMIVLILFHNEPLFQAASIFLLSICQVLYFLNMDPFQESLEKFKQVSCEVFMVFIELMFVLLVIDDYLDYFTYASRETIGWCCISGLITIVLTHVIIDIIQELIILKRIYKKFRISAESKSNQQNNQEQPILK